MVKFHFYSCYHREQRIHADAVDNKTLLWTTHFLACEVQSYSTFQIKIKEEAHMVVLDD